jgi:3-isopropylmalate/(R)-2-methylmalate dehydratase large subunit
VAPSEPAAQKRTLFDRIWSSHQVRAETEGSPAVLYVDLHLVHEVTSPQAFTELESRGLRVRRTDRTVATMDHSIPTTPPVNGKLNYFDAQAEAQVETLRRNCAAHGIELHAIGEAGQGIVHVIGPELGLTWPGHTVVCGDSHTSTHGAFGALAFGIGTSEVGHVLATQCILQRRPKTLEVRVEAPGGRLPRGVTAKDIILAIIARIGVGGGTGHVIEYTGPAIRALSMEERMTICNMSIEAGARAGLVAPDETTFAFLKGRPRAPQGAAWDAAVSRWRELRTDEGAQYDKSVTIDAADLQPMITWGTDPGTGVPVTGRVPQATDERARKALQYMGLTAGQPMLGHKIDVVFVGSCTNGRLSDLRLAAEVLKGRKVAPHVRALVVPGSRKVKEQAEAEGLDRIFKAAGAEWREPGCSMCLGMNGDTIEAGQTSVSTSNRNFEGRQGPGARTFLASPATAAASAIKGAVADPREVLS